MQTGVRDRVESGGVGAEGAFVRCRARLGRLEAGAGSSTWPSRGGASLDLDYEIHTAEEPEHPYAMARTVIVIVEAPTGKAVRMPEQLRTALESITGAPSTFRRT